MNYFYYILKRLNQNSHLNIIIYRNLWLSVNYENCSKKEKFSIHNMIKKLEN